MKTLNYLFRTERYSGLAEVVGEMMPCVAEVEPSINADVAASVESSLDKAMVSAMLLNCDDPAAEALIQVGAMGVSLMDDEQSAFVLRNVMLTMNMAMATRRWLREQGLREIPYQLIRDVVEAATKGETS